ncbi:MAG: small basic protein [Candidatus Omnitrophica bacterium]|nr:small basic protein [Candidatus Omnitrophota bacterium]
MSQHSSLKADTVGKRHRNVLKRHERIQTLQDTEAWGNRQSIYKLPKLKLIKLKVKKEKSSKEETPAEGTVAASPPAEGSQKPVQKTAQKPAQEPAKGKEKK